VSGAGEGRRDGGTEDEGPLSFVQGSVADGLIEADYADHRSGSDEPRLKGLKHWITMVHDAFPDWRHAMETSSPKAAKSSSAIASSAPTAASSWASYRQASRLSSRESTSCASKTARWSSTEVSTTGRASSSSSVSFPEMNRVADRFPLSYRISTGTPSAMGIGDQFKGVMRYLYLTKAGCKNVDTQGACGKAGAMCHEVIPARDRSTQPIEDIECSNRASR
jgi:hypothetical protein